MQKSKMGICGGLKIAVKRREAKTKGEKERYKHLNAEFQRIARRDKKAFFSDQCKKLRKTTEWERLGISSRKSEIPKEHFRKIILFKSGSTFMRSDLIPLFQGTEETGTWKV